MADSDDVGRRERSHLLKFNIEKIAQGYLQAAAAGEERPVILVINLRDKKGVRSGQPAGPATDGAGSG